MAMQRFTVKISSLSGRKLGMILVDSPLDEDCYDIRGGGLTLQNGDSESGSDGDVEVLPGSIRSAAVSLHSEFDAEAAAAARAAQGGRATPPVTNKRKRPTRVCVSHNSLVFMLAEHLLAAATNQDAKNDTACPQRTTFDPSNIDALIEWGRKNNPCVQHRTTPVPFETFNEEFLKFVLTGTVKRGDILEKIQYTRQPSSPPVARLVSAKGKCKSDKQKRRSRPYYRSDHYTSLYSENLAGADLAGILRSSENYPLYITFKRLLPGSNDDGTAGSTCSPPRKRLKKSESNIAPAIGNGNDVIDLLDSSDEEEGDNGDAETLVGGGNDVNGQAKSTSAEATIEKDSSTDSSSTLHPHPQIVPPDPRQMTFHDDDFVLTPFGPGKILSWRVERYASPNKLSGATVFRPTIIYSIDLHFGTCHVPAAQVKPITGTSYTEKTLITYQRVPLNGHDLLRLRPMTYLNDSILNFYLKYLKTQFEQSSTGKPITKTRGWDDLDGAGIHIFPSFCYTRIKNILGPASRNSKMLRTKIWNDLASWTKKVDIFKKQLLCFPINEHLHWTIVFVFHPGRLVRRYAKVLSGRNGSAISSESTTSSITNLNVSSSNNEASLGAVSGTTAVPGDMVMKSSDGDNEKTENQSQNNSISNESQATSEKSATDNSTSNAPTLPPGKKWLCDFCQEATFLDFNDAVEHEKICEKNIDWCMIHFDSGKHFKLHKTSEITGNIRKYLNAYYEAEYSSTHPGLTSFTTKNMPSFTAAVPQQDNTKDCGVFMLENAERVIRSTPLVDNSFVKMKGADKKSFFGSNGYDKHVIEKKRDDMLQLIQSLCREVNEVE